MATEERLNIIADHADTAATRLAAEAAAAAAPPPRPQSTTTTTTNTWGNNKARGLPTRPSSVTIYREISASARRLDPSSLGASHHRYWYSCSVIAPGVSSGTRLGSETRILPVLHWHSEQTNNTATYWSGSSTCKQCQQPTLVDQSETRQATSPPPHPSPPKLTGRPRWGRN